MGNLVFVMIILMLIVGCEPQLVPEENAGHDSIARADIEFA